jgi:ligand-binding SRPBCC domain-containing protein
MFKVEREILLPVPLEEAWNFFAQPKNLAEITPPEMRMELVDEERGPMYEGMVLRFKVSPLLGIKLNWTSEISKIVPLQYFIDTMIDGPFAKWHHQHFFEAADGGTLARDIIHYKPPFGLLGKAAKSLLIEKNINQLFEYRTQKLSEIFNKPKL